MQIVRPSTLLFPLLLAIIVGGGVAFVGAQRTPVGAWLGLAAVVPILYYGLRRPLRRWRSAQRRLPESSRAWLAAHVPLYTRLGDADRRRFERDVRFLLDEWGYEGVEGVEVDDALRLGVAAGGALLLHGRPGWELPPRRTILFYPGTFDDEYYDSDYAAYDGMAHAQGPVIFSAEAVRASWDDPNRGSNVVLHELAHLFDFDNTYADGAPSLLDPASAEAWSALVRREMQYIRMGRSILRSYAATNEAEFFAVAVEVFFERPEALQRRHPEVYDALAAFFDLDPLEVMGVARAEAGD